MAIKSVKCLALITSNTYKPFQGKKALIISLIIQFYCDKENRIVNPPLTLVIGNEVETAGIV